jgi:probable HAF family extracellular repeat protein
MRHPHILAALVILSAPAIAHDGDQGNGNFQAATYCVYEIPRLPGLPPGEISLDLRAINNRDQVVGWTTPAGAPPLHSFIWDRKRGIRDIGSLAGHPSMVAADLNDAGAIVGDATNFESNEVLAFIWRRHKGVRALDVSLGGVNSFAYGINRSGQVVGASETKPGTFHAYLREVNGDVLDLGAFPDGHGGSSATAVNDRGQVVGTRGDGQMIEGFLWDERFGMQTLIDDPPPFFSLVPRDINNGGVIVGETSGTNPTRAFRWTRRKGLQDLGSLGGLDTDYGTATAVNRWGTIVGASQTTSGLAHGFVWSRQTGMRDLNDLVDPSSELPPQAVLGLAAGINDFGSIAIIGFVPGELSQRAFLLVPQRHPQNACQ